MSEPEYQDLCYRYLAISLPAGVSRSATSQMDTARNLPSAGTYLENFTIAGRSRQFSRQRDKHRYLDEIRALGSGRVRTVPYKGRLSKTFNIHSAVYRNRYSCR